MLKRFIIGLVIGMLVATVIVYAEVAYIAASNEIFYDNSNSALTSNDVQSAVDEIYNAKHGCPYGHTCYDKKTVSSLQAGDYVIYKPSVASATIANTGASGVPINGTSTNITIYPSRLTLWRVLKINPDNTVDLISHYASTEGLTIYGLSGFKNLTSVLTNVASQYTNSNYTVGSHYLGYNGQSSTVSSVGSNWYGETYYTTEYNLVKSVLGTAVATNPEGGAVNYWLPSRGSSNTSGSTSNYYYFSPYYVNTSGSDVAASSGYCLSYCSYNKNSASSCTASSDCGSVYNFSVRPVVTLGAGLTFGGEGTAANPYRIGSTISS